jgi:hypothetical protein
MRTTLYLIIVLILSSCGMTNRVVTRQKAMMAQDIRDRYYLSQAINTMDWKMREVQIIRARDIRQYRIRQQRSKKDLVNQMFSNGGTKR